MATAPSARWVLAVVLHLAASVFLVVSVSTPWWVSGVVLEEYLHLGMWSACLQDFCMSVFEEDKAILKILGREWLVAAQGCACAGLAVVGVAYFIALCYRMYFRGRGQHSTLQLTSVVLFLGIALYSYSAIVFSYKTYSRLFEADHETNTLHYSYSFYCACASIISGLIGAIFYLLEYRHVTSYKIHYVPLN